jgi:hypothetical protein
MKENLQSVCSMLEFMLNEKTLEQSSTVKQEEKTSEQKSQKEQLQDLLLLSSAPAHHVPNE